MDAKVIYSLCFYAHLQSFLSHAQSYTRANYIICGTQCKMKMQVPGLRLGSQSPFPRAAAQTHGRWVKPRDGNLSSGTPGPGVGMKPLLSCTLSQAPEKGRREKVTTTLGLPGVWGLQRQEASSQELIRACRVRK